MKNKSNLNIKIKTNPKPILKPKITETTSTDVPAGDFIRRRGSVCRSPPQTMPSPMITPSVELPASADHHKTSYWDELQDVFDNDVRSSDADPVDTRRESTVGPDELQTVDEVSFDIVRCMRAEVESFMFNESNKISRNSIKFLLSKWTDMENLIYKVTLRNQKLQTKIEDCAYGLKDSGARSAEMVTYADVTKMHV